MSVLSEPGIERKLFPGTETQGSPHLFPITTGPLPSLPHPTPRNSTLCSNPLGLTLSSDTRARQAPRLLVYPCLSFLPQRAAHPAQLGWWGTGDRTCA